MYSIGNHFGQRVGKLQSKRYTVNFQFAAKQVERFANEIIYIERDLFGSIFAKYRANAADHIASTMALVNDTVSPMKGSWIRCQIRTCRSETLLTERQRLAIRVPYVVGVAGSCPLAALPGGAVKERMPAARDKPAPTCPKNRPALPEGLISHYLRPAYRSRQADRGPKVSSPRQNRGEKPRKGVSSFEGDFALSLCYHIDNKANL